MFRIKGTEAKLRTEAFGGKKTVAVVPNAEAPEDTDALSALQKSPDSCNDNFLIDHETVVLKWSSPDKGGLVESISSTILLRAVGALCNCRLEVAEDSPDIIIRGDNKDDTARVSRKLTTLDQAQRFSLPYVSSFPVLEAQVSFMLQITAIEIVKDCRATTILLPRDSPFFRRNASIMTILQNGIITNVKQSEHRPSSQSFLWRHHPNQSYDDFPEPLRTSDRRVVPPIEQQHSEISRWNDETKPQEYADAFEPTAVQESLASKASGVVPASPNSMSQANSPVKAGTKRGRVARGSTKAPPPQNTESALTQTSSSQAEKDSQLLLNASEDRDVSQLQIDSVLSVAPHNERLIDIESVNHVTNAPEIKPPFIPSLNTPVKSGSSSSSASGGGNATSSSVQPLKPWEVKVVKGASRGSLIDAGDHDHEVKKDIRYTMRQKKPANTWNSNNEVLKAFEREAKNILDLALSRPGPLSFEVLLGRLLIDTETISKEYRKPFAWTKRSSTLPRNWKSEVIPRVTTRMADVEYILGLSLPKGKRLFEGEPHARKVTYAISCKSRLNENIEIEIAQDGSFQVSSML